jgi:hypothetical protein
MYFARVNLVKYMLFYIIENCVLLYKNAPLWMHTSREYQQVDTLYFAKTLIEFMTTNQYNETDK